MFLSRMMSGKGSGIRLYRILIIVFSSTLPVLSSRPSLYHNGSETALFSSFLILIVKIAKSNYDMNVLAEPECTLYSHM